MRRIPIILAIPSIGLALQGCAAPRPLPAPIAQTSPTTGHFVTGVIVSVRTVDVQPTPGTNQVLAALGQPPAASIDPHVEIVIRRRDTSVTSIVESVDAAAGLAAGEPVAIVEAANTVIRPD